MTTCRDKLRGENWRIRRTRCIDSGEVKNEVEGDGVLEFYKFKDDVLLAFSISLLSLSRTKSFIAKPGSCSSDTLFKFLSGNHSIYINST